MSTHFLAAVRTVVRLLQRLASLMAWVLTPWHILLYIRVSLSNRPDTGEVEIFIKTAAAMRVGT